MSLLGLDVGTTGCKAIAFDLAGRQLAQAYREYPLLHPQPGWSELDTNQLWQSIVEVLRDTNQQLRSDPVRALAVSCQGEAVTAIDGKGKPLANFSVSFDHRTIPQCQWWRETWPADRLFKLTGMPLHPMYSINKIMWYKQNRPDVYRKARKFLCVEDFVNFKLTGRYCIDYCLAARTMAFDVVNKCWSDDILRSAELDSDLLPDVYPSGQAVGNITNDAAEDLGFESGVVVATGGHDQASGALGAGVIRSSLGVNTTGTSDVICPVFADPVFSDKMLAGNYACYPHVDPQQYISLIVNLTGGLLLRWYRDTFCRTEQAQSRQTGQDVYDIIVDQASSEINDIFFLPHFVGAGTPYFDSASRGALVGLTVDTTRQQISKSLLDSLNYEMKLNMNLLAEAGVKINELHAVGGGAKSRRWLQMKADTFGLPVSSMYSSEAASLGAAMLAGVSIETFNNLPDAVTAMVHKKQTYYPEQEKTRLYEDKYQKYVQLYPVLKDFNRQLSKDSEAD